MVIPSRKLIEKTKKNQVVLNKVTKQPNVLKNKKQKIVLDKGNKATKRVEKQKTKWS